MNQYEHLMHTLVRHTQHGVRNPPIMPRLHKIQDNRILITRTDVEGYHGVHNNDVWNNLTVWAGTWNVNAVTTPFSIAEMVGINENAPMVNMYAVGLQEVDDPGMASISFGLSENAKKWTRSLKDYFVTTCGLELLMIDIIGGTLLAVYVQKQYFKMVSQVSVSTIALGMAGIAKNKGAVGVRFQMGEKTFCIVCAHLKAGEKGYTDYTKRVCGYKRIVDDMKFKYKQTRNSVNTTTYRMLDSDNILFMGDLNFRIIPNKTLDSLKLLVIDPSNTAGMLAAQLYELQAYDELLYAMTYDDILSQFNEGTLTFKPTYKYANKTDNYDGFTTRMPAWTDRILWKGDAATLLQYRPKHTTGSDHKPLHAVIVFNNIMSNGVHTSPRRVG